MVVASGRFQNIHLLDTSCNPPTRATASKQHSCSWSKDGDKAARWLSAHDATANRTVGCDLSAALPALQQQLPCRNPLRFSLPDRKPGHPDEPNNLAFPNPDERFLQRLARWD